MGSNPPLLPPNKLLAQGTEEQCWTSKKAATHEMHQQVASLGDAEEKKRGGEKNKTMTFSGLQENRESLESTGEQFQWKCREELIESYWGRKDSLLIGSYMNEKRFHEAGGV